MTENKFDIDIWKYKKLPGERILLMIREQERGFFAGALLFTLSTEQKVIQIIRRTFDEETVMFVDAIDFVQTDKKEVLNELVLGVIREFSEKGFAVKRVL